MHCARTWVDIRAFYWVHYSLKIHRYVFKTEVDAVLFRSHLRSLLTSGYLNILWDGKQLENAMISRIIASNENNIKFLLRNL